MLTGNQYILPKFWLDREKFRSHLGIIATDR